MSYLQAIQTSLQYLDGRIDLMLMHAPGDPSVRADTWRALEEAKAEVRGSENSRLACPCKISRAAFNCACPLSALVWLPSLTYTVLLP